eukprot:129365-Chlamydomonas_euryale.AAC.1
MARSVAARSAPRPSPTVGAPAMLACVGAPAMRVRLLCLLTSTDHGLWAWKQPVPGAGGGGMQLYCWFVRLLCGCGAAASPDPCTCLTAAELLQISSSVSPHVEAAWMWAVG